MSKSSITRRQFNRMLVASAVSWNAQGRAQEPASQPAEDSIHAWLPAPMPAEQAQKIAEALKSLQKTLEKLRAYPLPEGSEPAFTFHPGLSREEKR